MPTVDQGPTPPVHLPPDVFQPEAQKEAEKVFALSLPSLWLCLGCSIKVSESMVWVLVSQGELWVLQPGDPRKKRVSVLLGEGWKRKRKEGGMEGGQFKGSECQVLMCLFSITAVPGKDREKKQTATLIYYTQTFNSILKAIILVSYLSPNFSYLFISNLHTWNVGNWLQNTVH